MSSSLRGLRNVISAVLVDLLSCGWHDYFRKHLLLVVWLMGPTMHPCDVHNSLQNHEDSGKIPVCNVHCCKRRQRHETLCYWFETTSNLSSLLMFSGFTTDREFRPSTPTPETYCLVSKKRVFAYQLWASCFRIIPLAQLMLSLTTAFTSEHFPVSKIADRVPHFSRINLTLTNNAPANPETKNQARHIAYC